MTRISILFVSFVAFAGCSKKDGNGAASGKASEAKPAGPIKLAKLKLQIDVAGDPQVGDAIMGDGVQLTGETIGALGVEVMKEPKALEDEKSDAGMFNPKNLKAETLPDGWLVSFDNTGSMGANYFVTVRRDIGGKSYKCYTTGSNPDQAKACVAACKSLRAGG